MEKKQLVALCREKKVIGNMDMSIKTLKGILNDVNAGKKVRKARSKVPKERSKVPKERQDERLISLLATHEYEHPENIQNQCEDWESENFEEMEMPDQEKHPYLMDLLSHWAQISEQHKVMISYKPQLKCLRCIKERYLFTLTVTCTRVSRKLVSTKRLYL
jgi:hypothetical protein